MDRYCVIPLTCDILGIFIKTISGMSGTKGGRRDGISSFTGCRVAILQDEKSSGDAWYLIFAQ